MSGQKGKGKRKVTYKEKLSGKSVYLNSMKCFKCNDNGHRASECPIGIQRCFKCGQVDHMVEDCRTEIPTCYNCGELGHQMYECLKVVMPNAKSCYKCDGLGHLVNACTKTRVTCYNCGEPGHVSIHCPKPKQVQVGGKALAGTGSQSASADR